MPLVSAFLVPGSPLPLLRQENPAWAGLVAGYRAAATALAASKPDVILVYSTQWIAVLDQLWQTRPRVEGLHVDENWYEYGDLPYDMTIDTEFASACVVGSKAIGVRSRPVDYDAFPIDTGTIVANTFLNPDGQLPLVISSNNVYHDPGLTERMGGFAIATANRLGRRVAVVGVGGLSGSIFRDEIDITTDRIRTPEDDAWNRKILGMIEAAEIFDLRKVIPDYAKEARVEMGFKHFSFILGAMSGVYTSAKTHAYGATYGAGAAVIEFKL